jgi:hypothetical protein
MFKFNYLWIVVAIVVLLVIYMMMKMKKPGEKMTKDGWTVYGTTSCGWTTKQLKEMDDNGITYKFIDCESASENCVDISGFPTLKNDDGTVKVGFTPM